MSTPATTTQDNLRSRLPDPSQFIPEIAEIAGATAAVPPAHSARADLHDHGGLHPVRAGGAHG